MNRILAGVASALIVMAPALGYAQDTYQNDTDKELRGGVGIKGGWSWADVSNRGALPGDLDTYSGLTIGLTATTGMPVGFGVEALYARRGLNGAGARQLDYVDVPAYLRLAIPAENFAPYAYAGPQVSFEVRCKSSGPACSSDRPSMTYAGVIGAGLRLGGPGAMMLEGRYMYGLTDLKLNTVSTNDSYKDRSFMALLGFGF